MALVSLPRRPLAFALGGLFLALPLTTVLADPPAAPVARPDGSPRVAVSLPTANDALLRGDPAGFYQYVERNFHDVITYPWEGGQYGFVRDPVDSPLGVIFTRFHEGIDIKPMARDARGEPMDDVLSIADGRVVHASAQPGASNYGRYVVVEHVWDGCPYYSLYAHLSEIAAVEGTGVFRGQRLGRMGHTGEGIDRARSHVHLEINLMLNTHFDQLVVNDPGDPNKHGNYNGLNLSGFDAARFFLELRSNPNLTVPGFFASEEVYFKVLVPAGPQPPDLLRLYPWMGGSSVSPPVSQGSKATAAARPASWEISFTRAGLPVKVLPSPTVVKQAVLSFVKSSTVPYWEMTHRLVNGVGPVASLSFYGQRLAGLVGTVAPDVSPTPAPAPAGR